jgi:hypothetical protein
MATIILSVTDDDYISAYRRLVSVEMPDLSLSKTENVVWAPPPPLLPLGTVTCVI